MFSRKERKERKGRKGRKGRKVQKTDQLWKENGRASKKSRKITGPFFDHVIQSSRVL